MKPPDGRRKPRLLIVSGALAATIAATYTALPLGLTGLFIWPLALWVLFGAALAAVALKSPAKHRLAVIGLWLVVWLALDAQPWAFLPRIPYVYSQEFEIVSLNCAGGDPKAAAEAAATGADLILLQESPNASQVEALRASLGADWTAVHGLDGSILARGPLRRIPVLPRTHNFVAAEWRGALVVSLRLQPPIFRLDYWSPECWRDYAQNRAARIAEFREVMAWVHANRGDRDVIIGGDFNAPPDRVMMADLKPLAQDAFATRGRGWGATAINRLPLVRIDQVWLAGNVSATHAFARTTKYSDHRMVIVTASSRTARRKP